MGPIRTRLLIVAAVVAVVTVGAALVLQDDSHEGVSGAVRLAEDQSRFDSSAEAGDTFALMASVLMDDARACVAEHSREHPRCVALSEGAAYAQTVAVTAATCTGPGVFELRTRALGYLRAIARVDDAKDAARPPVPDIPSCF